MQFPLQITLRGMSHSPALEAEIRARAAKLEQFHAEIVSCRVVVEIPARHKHQGKEFAVNIDLHLPGREVAVTRSHAEDVFVAVRNAFDVARRKLEDHSPRHPGSAGSEIPG
jgi:ribosomal subunit interface protein